MNELFSQRVDIDAVDNSISQRFKENTNLATFPTHEPRMTNYIDVSHEVRNSKLANESAPYIQPGQSCVEEYAEEIAVKAHTNKLTCSMSVSFCDRV